MKTILIVDDSPIVLETTGVTLSNAGYRVVLRSRAEGTVSAILQERPDLVLLDVNMPHVSGETIATILSKADPNRRTIVLLHSSLPPQQLRQKAADVGAQGYIHKGGSALDLVNQVAKWLPRSTASSSSSQERVAAPAQATVVEAAPSSPKPPRQSAATPPERKGVPHVLFVDDDHFTLSLYRRALQNQQLSIDLADTGGRALQRIFSDDPPDVVVCDLLMPDTDGIKVFERAVQHDSSWRRRFVFVTGATSVGRINQFLTDDAIQVVYKPIDVTLLMRAVRQAAGAAENAAAR